MEHYKTGNLIITYKNVQRNFNIWDIEIEKNKFYCNHSDFFKQCTIFSSEENYKYFIGYLYDNHNFKLLHKMLPKTSPYGKKL